MDDLLAGQIESLLGTHYSTKGMGKNVLTLSGFLGDATMPEPIATQLERLSHLVMLQDVFDALIQSLNQANARPAPPKLDPATSADGQANQSTIRLLDQIEAVRNDMNACAPINYSALISWLVTRAREKNILRSRSRR